jgi:hypothetical protein
MNHIEIMVFDRVEQHFSTARELAGVAKILKVEYELQSNWTKRVARVD